MFVRSRPSRTRAERSVPGDRALEAFDRALIGAHGAALALVAAISQPLGDCGGRRIRPHAWRPRREDILGAWAWIILDSSDGRGPARCKPSGRCGRIARLIFDWFKIDAFAQPRDRSAMIGPRFDYLALAPAAAAICYPFLLQAFHAVVGTQAATPSLLAIFGATLILAVAFVVPFLALALACRPDADPGARRLAYAGVAVPTLYVFLGVVQALIHSPIPDEIVWCVLWLAIAIWSQAASNPVAATRPTVGQWRIVHGMTAAVLCLYVAFHLANHLFGLIGPDAHAAVMKIGRVVYRSAVGEPLLVATMLFQIGTGLFLAWRWSAASQGFHRTFQVASGAYLSLYILGHMNSVFIYARSFLGIPTDWNFAIGAPTGLIHDAWNIRLLPHYALGVFFVLSHLASGLRVVLIAHGVDRSAANRLWGAGVAISAVLSAAIIAGMCGIRIIN